MASQGGARPHGGQAAGIALLPARLLAAGWRAFAGRPSLWLASIVGFGFAYGTLLTVVAVGTGLEQTLAANVRNDRAVVMRLGAPTESGSSLLRDQVDVGVGNDGVAIRSPEFLILARDAAMKRAGATGPVVVRGVTEAGFEIRPEVRLVAGRMFRPGLNEVVVGVGAAHTFEGLHVGGEFSHYDFEKATWEVVGHFAADGSSYESEIWVDLHASQQMYRGGSNMLSVAWLQLETPEVLVPLRRELQDDPRYPVDLLSERSLVERRSGVALDRARVFGYAVGAVLGIGALFMGLGVAHTISAQARETVGLLATLGFPPSAIGGCITAVTLALCVAGCALGAVVAFAGLGGLTSSTVDGYGLQLSFAFGLDVRDCLGAASLMFGAALFGALAALVTASKSALGQLAPL